MGDPYRKQILWNFEAGGECWAITKISENREHVEIEEMRKNGQEDTHVYVEANLIDGRWVVDPEGAEYGIDRYFGAEFRQYIEAYLDGHGLPRNPEAEALKEIMGHVTGRPWLTNPDITYTDLVIILDRHGIPVQTKGEVSDG